MSGPLVRCEGSDWPPSRGSSFCPMCGDAPGVLDGRLMEHDRLDILALLTPGEKRGKS